MAVKPHGTYFFLSLEIFISLETEEEDFATPRNCLKIHSTTPSSFPHTNYLRSLLEHATKWYIHIRTLENSSKNGNLFLFAPENLVFIQYISYFVTGFLRMRRKMIHFRFTLMKIAFNTCTGVYLLSSIYTLYGKVNKWISRILYESLKIWLKWHWSFYP